MSIRVEVGLSRVSSGLGSVVRPPHRRTVRTADRSPARVPPHRRTVPLGSRPQAAAAYSTSPTAQTGRRRSAPSVTLAPVGPIGEKPHDNGVPGVGPLGQRIRSGEVVEVPAGMSAGDRSAIAAARAAGHDCSMLVHPTTAIRPHRQDRRTSQAQGASAAASGREQRHRPRPASAQSTLERRCAGGLRRRSPTRSTRSTPTAEPSQE